MLSFFPRGVLDEILNLIESVSEDFPSYSYRSFLWKTLMHKAVRPSIYFFRFFHINQAEQIEKEVICVQILLKIHLTEHGRFFMEF